MTAGQLLLACALDAALGDPRWLPHPVRLLGRVIAWYDGLIRRVARHPAAERAAGIVLAIGLPSLSYLAASVVIQFADEAHELIGKAVGVYLAVTTLAMRDLVDHARAVRDALIAGSLQQARNAVALIVGRDTMELSESEIVRATVETIAESASDGILAPLFYLVLGGPPLALAYKAVNTLDSMVGHRERKYRYLGWASAKLDDAANWLPARLTGVLLALASGMVTCDRSTMQHAWKILRRDGSKHPSPNSGWPEAAMAGALHVQLGGINLYRGVPSVRPRLGDDGEPLTVSHINRALTLMLAASGTGVLFATAWLSFL
jgi:adenosylcobinamide-phosphate synthase